MQGQEEINSTRREEVNKYSKVISFGFFGHFASLVNPLICLLYVHEGVPQAILLLEPGYFPNSYLDPLLAFVCVGVGMRTLDQQPWNKISMQYCLTTFHPQQTT